MAFPFAISRQSSRKYRRLSRRSARPYRNRNGVLDFNLAHQALTPYDLARFGVTTTGANGMVWNPASRQYEYAPHNLATFSTDISNVGLTTSGSGAKAASAVSSYVGGTTQLLSRGTANGYFGKTASANGTITLQKIVSNISHRFALRVQGTYPNRGDAVFAADGTLIGTAVTGTALSASATSRHLGGGIFMLSLTVRLADNLSATYFGPTDGSTSISSWEGSNAEASSAVDHYIGIAYGSKTFDAIRTTSAAVWLPRLDYNPQTGEARGPISEPTQQNFALYAADISNAAWAGTGYTKAAANPIIDGGVPQKITSTATGAMTLNQLIGTFSGASDTALCIIESGNTDYGHIEFYNSTNATTVARTALQYSNGNVVLGAGTGTVFASKLMDVGPNGGKVYLVAITAVSTAGNSRRVQLRPNASVSGTNSGDYFFVHYVGCVTGYVIPLSPIVTQGSAVTRSGDTALTSLPSWVAGRPVGPELVANGRFDTNVDGWTVTGGTLSVAGGTIIITSSTNGVAARGTQTFATGIGKVYVVKGRLRKTTEGTVTAGIYVNIAGATSGYNALTTWRDVAFYFVATSTSHTINLDIAQTNMVAGQAAEFDDISIMELDTSVTMMAEYEVLAYNDGNARTVALLSDGTANNRIYERILSTTTMDYGVVAGNTGQGGSQTNNISALIGRVCSSSAINDLRAAFNSVGSNVDPLGSVPAGLNRLDIGHSLNGAQVNGWVRRVCLVAGAMTQAEINVASAVGW